MSKVVTRIARIVIFSLIFNESSFSLLISIFSTEHYNKMEKKLEKEDFFGSKMKKKNFELIEKCPKPVEFGIIRIPYPSRSQISNFPIIYYPWDGFPTLANAAGV